MQFQLKNTERQRKITQFLGMKNGTKNTGFSGLPVVGAVDTIEQLALLAEILGYVLVDVPGIGKDWVYCPLEEEISWTKWKVKQTGEKEFYVSPAKVDWFMLSFDKLWNKYAYMEFASKFDRICFVLRKMPRTYEESLKTLRPDVPAPTEVTAPKRKASSHDFDNISW